MNGAYTVTAGVQIDSDSSSGDEFPPVEVSQAVSIWYLRQDPMPQVVIETWMAVWEHFANTKDYKKRLHH